MHPSDRAVLQETRRQFFARGARGLGVAALATAIGDDLRAGPSLNAPIGGLPGLPHFAPKAKRAITCTWSARRRNWICTTTSRA